MILAAGSSSRLGKPKQLVEFKSLPLLQNVLNIAEKLSFDTKILVLGANSERIKDQIEIGNFEVVYNEEWEEGMASSIRKGIQYSKKDLDHMMILVSDQPLISSENLEKLIEKQLESKAEATFSEYDGNIGVPAIFSKAIFSELAALKGDQGAKKLIVDEKLRFETVKFEGGNFDVDTKEDVEKLKELE